MNMPRLVLLDDFFGRAERVHEAVRADAMTADQGVMELARLIASIVEALRRNQI